MVRHLLFALFTLAAVGIGSAQVDGMLSNPIFPGDHPDPSVIRVGKTYWTASTAGNWTPLFSLYKSIDLHHWTPAGAIFERAPEWAKGDFWAPEIVYDRGKVLVYYVGRDLKGTLCVASASADTPEGPYEDHGPLICQDDGSIDPAFMRDEQGKPYLIWKEDGNSRHELTKMWAQPLAPDLAHLVGDKTQILINEPETWEGGVVEAPYLMRHNGRFYMFYAGNACCGTGCHYAEGVARAGHLLGPWVKDPANPIIAANGVWRCPGHGSAVQTPAGKDLFVYHAYPASGTVYLGRESLIDSISWNAKGWPVVNGGRGPGSGGSQPATAAPYVDNFTGTKLSPEWKWPVGHEPQGTVAGGKLTLTVPQPGTQSFVARSLTTGIYVASVAVPSGGDAETGLGLIGDAQDDIVLSRHGQTVELWQSSHQGRNTLWKQDGVAGDSLTLRVSSTAQGQADFSYRTGTGAWVPAGETVELKGLLPWDSGLRVGLVVAGNAGTSGGFASFRVGEHATN